MVATLNHVHKSRFGWHPCDKETFLKLKELNKIFVDALHKKAAWQRWERKEPQNRIARQKLRDSDGRVVGYGTPVPLEEPKLNGLLNKQIHLSNVDANGKNIIVNGTVNFINNAELIAQEYKYARTPQSSEKGIRQLKLTLADVERMLVIAKGE